MNSVNADALLLDMRTMAARAQGLVQVTETPGEDSGFVALLRSGIEHVNKVQKNSAALAEGFEKGEDIDLAQVMIASQKANIAFQAANQVRNRLVSSYQDVMNMPI